MHITNKQSILAAALALCSATYSHGVIADSSQATVTPVTVELVDEAGKPAKILRWSSAKGVLAIEQIEANKLRIQPSKPGTQTTIYVGVTCSEKPIPVEISPDTNSSPLLSKLAVCGGVAADGRG